MIVAQARVPRQLEDGETVEKSVVEWHCTCEIVVTDIQIAQSFHVGDVCQNRSVQFVVA